MKKFSIVLFIITASFITSCSKDGASSTDAAGSGTGVGGSLARFTIVGNYLYLADYSSLEVYDISNPLSTVKKSTTFINSGVETIFPYKDQLFIGSTQGMFIYSLSNPAAPVKLGSALHVRSCDPVVANDSIAYVTLRGGSRCGPATDGLYIYNIQTLTAPKQKFLLPLSNPYGLGLKDSVVFVCRGAQGLTAINVKNSSAPVTMYTKTDGEYFDVIPHDNLLICYVKTGLILYDITNLKAIEKVGNYNY